MSNFNRDDRSGPRRDFGQRYPGRQSFGNQGGRREMHKAVCSECGKNCEVPFEPTGSKPVFCSECFEKKGGKDDSRRFQDRGPRRPDFGRRDEPRPQNNEQFEAINRKLDKILEMLTVAPLKEEKKKETPKKKTPVSKK